MTVKFRDRVLRDQSLLTVLQRTFRPGEHPVLSHIPKAQQWYWPRVARKTRVAAHQGDNPMQ